MSLFISLLVLIKMQMSLDLRAASLCPCPCEPWHLTVQNLRLDAGGGRHTLLGPCSSWAQCEVWWGEGQKGEEGGKGRDWGGGVGPGYGVPPALPGMVR